MTGKMQAKLALDAHTMAAEVGLGVYSVTTDGTANGQRMDSQCQ